MTIDILRQLIDNVVLDWTPEEAAAMSAAALSFYSWQSIGKRLDGLIERSARHSDYFHDAPPSHSDPYGQEVVACAAPGVHIVRHAADGTDRIVALDSIVPTLSPEIKQRQDFGMLADTRGLNVCVEIGTDRGNFARRFLETSRCYLLYCVDNWEPYWEMPWLRDSDYQTALHHLMPFGDRCRILRTTSEQAAVWIPDPVDFVYIDANHEEESVEKDLNVWWNRLSERGVLAGDDYDADHPGVIAAVKRFAAEQDRKVYLTVECGKSPSWYLYRNEPKEMIVCAYRD